MLLTRIALISLSQETEHGAMNEYASPGCCDAVMLDAVMAGVWLSRLVMQQGVWLSRRIRCYLKQGVWLSHLVEAYQLVFTHVREYCLKREHLGFFEEAQP